MELQDMKKYILKYLANSMSPMEEGRAQGALTMFATSCESKIISKQKV